MNFKANNCFDDYLMLSDSEHLLKMTNQVCSMSNEVLADFSL